MTTFHFQGRASKVVLWSPKSNLKVATFHFQGVMLEKPGKFWHSLLVHGQATSEETNETVTYWCIVSAIDHWARIVHLVGVLCCKYCVQNWKIPKSHYFLGRGWFFVADPVSKTDKIPKSHIFSWRGGSQHKFENFHYCWKWWQEDFKILCRSCGLLLTLIIVNINTLVAVARDVHSYCCFMMSNLKLKRFITPFTVTVSSVALVFC